MRYLMWIIFTCVLLFLTGCKNSTKSDENVELEYPDIPGLVVFYDFNGTLDNAVSDMHHAVATGTVTYVADHRGIANSAVQVDDNIIQVANHSDLDITGAITLAAWVKPEISDHAFVAVVDKDYFCAYSFGMNGGAAPDTVAMTAFLVNQYFGSDNIVPFGMDTWSHIVFTYDESTGQGKLYLNGNPAGSRTCTVTMGSGDTDLRIGRSKYGDKYNGAIDQLAVFNRALTPAEIEDLFAFQ